MYLKPFFSSFLHYQYIKMQYNTGSIFHLKEPPFVTPVH